MLRFYIPKENEFVPVTDEALEQQLLADKTLNVLCASQDVLARLVYPENYREAKNVIASLSAVYKDFVLMNIGTYDVDTDTYSVPISIDAMDIEAFRRTNVRRKVL